MKARLIIYIRTYLLFLFVFVVQKPLFILTNSSLFIDTTWGEMLQVMPLFPY